MARIHSSMGVGNLKRGSPLPSLCRHLQRRVDSTPLHSRLRKAIIVPFEDGISKATKNLDKAAEAAPTSKVVHATDRDKKNEDAKDRAHDEERTRADDSQNDVEDRADDSDD